MTEYASISGEIRCQTVRHITGLSPAVIDNQTSICSLRLIDTDRTNLTSLTGYGLLCINSFGVPMWWLKAAGLR